MADKPKIDTSYPSTQGGVSAPETTVKASDLISKNRKSAKETTTDSVNYLAGLAKLFGNYSGNSNILSKTPSIISQASNNGANTVWANTGSTWKNALANVGQFLGITKNVEDTIPVNFSDTLRETANNIVNSSEYQNLSDLAKQNVWKNTYSQFNLNSESPQVGSFIGGW